MSIPIAVGQPVPLFVSLGEQGAGHFVYARIVTRNPYDILADELLLEPEYFEGDYTNLDFLMPDVPFIDVIYTVFEDDGYTIMRQEREVFVRRDLGSGGGSITAGITEAVTLTAAVEACS